MIFLDKSAIIRLRTESEDDMFFILCSITSCQRRVHVLLQRVCKWRCGCVKSLFFVEFGSQDEVSICVVNEYLLSGLLSHTARHTQLNSKWRCTRDKISATPEHEIDTISNQTRYSIHIQWSTRLYRQCRLRHPLVHRMVTVCQTSPPQTTAISSSPSLSPHSSLWYLPSNLYKPACSCPIHEPLHIVGPSNA